MKSSEILTILISAFVGAVITSLVSIFKKKYVDNSKNSKKYNNLLRNVYEPLMLYTQINTFDIGKIKNILEENSLVIPAYLDSSDFEHEVCKAENTKHFDTKSDAYRHIESNYNWLLKKNNEEFDKSKIDEKSLFIYPKIKERYESISFWATPLFIIVLFVLSSVIKNSDNENFAFIFFSILILFFGFVLGRSLQKYLDKKLM